METYEDEPSSFLSGKAAWNSNMKVISRSDLQSCEVSCPLFLCPVSPGLSKVCSGFPVTTCRLG